MALPEKTGTHSSQANQCEEECWSEIQRELSGHDGQGDLPAADAAAISDLQLSGTIICSQLCKLRRYFLYNVCEIVARGALF